MDSLIKLISCPPAGAAGALQLRAPMFSPKDLMTEESFNLPEWNEAVGQMIAHLDDTAFPGILISAIRDLVPIDKSLITLEKHLKYLRNSLRTCRILRRIKFMS